MRRSSPPSRPATVPEAARRRRSPRRRRRGVATSAAAPTWRVGWRDHANLEAARAAGDPAAEDPRSTGLGNAGRAGLETANLGMRICWGKEEEELA
jgi:hypothetical protein